MNSLSVLVPLKSPEDSKTRLQPPLSSEERRQLTLALYEQVFTVFEFLSSEFTPAVVTDSESLTDRAEEKGVQVFNEPQTKSTLGGIIDSTINDNTEIFHEGVLVIPADLPFLTGFRLQNFLEFCQGNSVVLNPDEKDEGTNALWRSPAEVIPCQYSGTASFDEHIQAAREKGMEPVITRKNWLSRDLDTYEDLCSLFEANMTLKTSFRLTAEKIIKNHDRYEK